MSKVNNCDMPAMPCDDIVLRDNNCDLHGCPVTGSGLTKREQFAAMAMQGLSTGDYNTFLDMADDAIGMADALLAQLEKGNE